MNWMDIFPTSGGGDAPNAWTLQGSPARCYWLEWVNSVCIWLLAGVGIVYVFGSPWNNGEKL